MNNKISELISGAPRRTLTYKGNGHAVDETGKPYHVESVEQRETRRRILAQGASGRKRSFVWNRLEGLPYVISSLTTAQCGYLLVLSSHVDYEGLLVKSENNKEPMSTDDMRKALRASKSTFYDFLDACINYGIITEVDGRFYIAQHFHFRGKTAGDRVVKTYIRKLREMYKEVSAHDIGLLYRMLPYIHVETNMLCANPDEPIPKNIRKFNRRELAEAVGVNPVIISRAIGRMTFEGNSVFAKITTATEGTFYMLNPDIFERKAVEYDPSVKAIFGLD
ncbi:hypothetical protein [Lederbergia citri]|uniref:Uncharacterized protein n=1 Tax=Lederbergia citri TaxID=2833580 RepID=A0A942TCF7_9BACI|nr:hypothetical protein [Lederbergia citri]MBS4195341.1 hypothetical protein [Lederbergia citri]